MDHSHLVPDFDIDIDIDDDIDNHSHDAMAPQFEFNNPSSYSKTNATSTPKHHNKIHIPITASATDFHCSLVPHNNKDRSHPQLRKQLEAEAEAEAAIVPSLSVCSNHLTYQTAPPDQHPTRAQSDDSKTSGSLRSRRKYFRTKTARIHHFSDRNQRNKIKKKMRQLRQLIPNCDSRMGKAAILDEAIVYLKALQLQLKMLSLSPPPMMMGNYPPTFPMLGFHHSAPSFVPLLSVTLTHPHPSSISLLPKRH